MNFLANARQVTNCLRTTSGRGLVLVLLGASMLGSQANTSSATLVGDLVFGEMLFKDDPNMGNLFDPTPKPSCPLCIVPGFPASSTLQPLALVVDPDIVFPEFIFRESGLLDVTADVDETTIDLAVVNTSGSPATEAPAGWEIRITDMNWDANGGLPGILTSATVVDDSLFPGLTASVINSGTGILIDFPGRATANPGTGPAGLAQQVLDAYNAGGQLTATISFTVQHMPEPSTVALLATAALVLTGRGRRIRGSFDS